MPLRRLSRALLAVLASALCAAGSASAHDPTVTEFTTGLTSNANPWGITAGPSDSLWFTENLANTLGSLDVSSLTIGELTTLPLSGDARGIAAGPDGNLWVTLTGGSGKIARITPTGTVTEFAADPAPSYPVDITAGPDGNLWFVSQSPEFVGRIATDGTVTRFDLGITQNSDLSSITAGPDGALWFTESANPGRIGRITTSGAVSEYSAGLTPNMAPTDITAGPDGNLWFTEVNDPGGIGRITPSGTITEFSDGLTANSQPRSIAAGADGALWFTESADPGAIGRITTGGNITEHRLGLTDNVSPWQIAAGPDGNMWFTGFADPGLIARITVPPGVKDLGPLEVDQSSASVKAKIRANDQDTYFHVEYGPTTALGSQTDSVYVGDDWQQEHVVAQIGGLAAGTKYWFRFFATNGAGDTIGQKLTFTTKAAAVVDDGKKPPADGTPAAEKKPDFARTVMAETGAGAVKVKLPGTGNWRPLRSTDGEIPVGAFVDTRHGSIALTTASASGSLQSGNFGGGVFSVHQPRGARGRVDLRLRGGNFSNCPRPRSRRARRSDASASASRGRRVRRLWGRDRGGRFRTHGRHSHATVRGTRWLTEDRCGGTFTRVTDGAVAVRDRVRRRTVVLRAGDHYLARRPRR